MTTIDGNQQPIAAGVAALLPVPDALATDAFAQERVALRSLSHEALLGKGDAFPDALLVAANGRETTIAAERAGGRAVVVFYRGSWCPFCNIALRAYRDHLYPTLREHGVALIAISPQLPDGTLSMQEKDHLEFAVVSDVGNTIAAALGILTEPTPEAIRSQLDHGLDLTTVNGDGTVVLPMPTTVIINEDGTIEWIDVHPDYSHTTEPAEVLARLNARDR